MALKEWQAKKRNLKRTMGPKDEAVTHDISTNERLKDKEVRRSRMSERARMREFLGLI